MINSLFYKDFYGSIDYSEEDNIFHGKILGINGTVTYEGNSIPELRSNFEKTVDFYINICKERGNVPNPPSITSINVYIDSFVHEKASLYSSSKHKSIDSIVQEALLNYINT